MSVDTLADKLWEKTGFCDADHGVDLSCISLNPLATENSSNKTKDKPQESFDSKEEESISRKNPNFACVGREEVVRTQGDEDSEDKEEEMDNSSPKVEDFMGHLMKFMSAEMKRRKEDRNREKQAKNLERKRIQREEKDLDEIQAFRRTQAALSTLPKILDSQQLDIAIETLESALQQNHIPTCSWNYMLFTALTGKFQELAADIPHSEEVPYPEFKKRLLQAAGYTQNAAGLQLWNNSYDLYSTLSPAQWVARQKRLALRIMEGCQSLTAAAERTAMASIYAKLGKRGRAYLDSRPIDTLTSFLDALQGFYAAEGGFPREDGVSMMKKMRTLHM